MFHATIDVPTNTERCRVCNDPRLLQIEASLTVKGATMRGVAELFDISRDSVMRHAHRHMGRVEVTRGPLPRLRVIGHIPDPPPPPPQPEPEPEPPPPEPEPEKPKTEAEQKEAFLDHLGETGSQIKSRRHVGIKLGDQRRWLEQDEKFGFAFNIAIEQAKDALIDTARDRAITGTRSVLQVYRKRQLIEERVEYKPSDAALLALLKAYRPEMFGDKLTVTQTTVVKAIDAHAWEAV